MNTEYIKNLNSRFAVGDDISFIAGEGGMPIVAISTALCDAELSIYGAHMLSFIPKGFDDLLWVSRDSIYKEGTAIRGGIPVCWPWFGAHPLESSVYSHGFARRNSWQLIKCAVDKDGIAVINLELTGDEDQMPGWPYPFQAEIEVRAGSKLEVELKSINKGDVPFEIKNALHTYFSVGDVRKIRVVGLDGVSYGDDTASGAIKKQIGDITFSSEVDRNYRNSSDKCEIIDPGKNRKIIVSKKGSLTTVVWNPWVEKAAALPDFANDEYLEMVCVETVNSFDDTRKVMPGSSHSMTTIISAEKLD